MLSEEEKLRALLSCIRTHEELPGYQDGVDRFYRHWNEKGIERHEYQRLFSTLKEQSLVTGDFVGFVDPKENMPRLSCARTTSKGILTLEKNLPILPDSQQLAPASQTFNISHAHNVAAGNNNTIQQTFNQSVQVLIDQIEQSNGSPEEKAEAKSLLRQFLEHPLVTKLAPTVVGAILASL